MKTKLFSTSTLAALTTLSAFALSNPVAAADEIQLHELDGIAKVDFYSSKSNVTLIGSDRDDLELGLEKPLTGFDPEKVTQSVTRDGDTIVIKFEYAKEKRSWWSWGDNNKGYKSATLHVPATLAAKIKTSGGNITAEAMRSSITLNTSGGNVAASDLTGPLHIQTSGGNINIEGSLSVLNAHTSGGHITAKLHSPLLAPLVLETSGGNVSASLEAGIQAPAELRTSGGSVSISLPHDQAFAIFAKSNGGNVSLNHGGSFRGTLDKKKIEGTINGEGPLVKMSTNGGRVNIREI